MGSLIDKDKIKLMISATTYDAIFDNSEWKFLSLRQTASWYYDIPGKTDEISFMDNEWPVVQFKLSNYFLLRYRPIRFAENSREF